MPEFSYTKDPIFKYESKIKCLSVAGDGTFYGRIITIYTHSWTNVQSIVNRWNIGGANHRYIDGIKLPMYQYSLER